MDRSWMKASRISEDYENGVKDFLQFSQSNAPSLQGKYLCPCVNNENGRRQTVNDIRSHLICDRIIPNYTIWIWHGESPNMATVSQSEPVNANMGNRIEDMIHDLGQEGFQQAYAPLYHKIENASNNPLYSGCTSFTRLFAVLALVNLKA